MLESPAFALAIVGAVSVAKHRDEAVWRWELTGEPFGRDRPLDDPDADGKRFTFDLRFPGQRYDDVTGLHYNYFRDYDPAVCRYVQSAPIGLRGGVSTFAYVGSAPSILADPSGLNPAIGLCFAPVVGWGSCAALAGGAILIGGCIASGICELASEALHDLFEGGSAWLSESLPNEAEQDYQEYKRIQRRGPMRDPIDECQNLRNLIAYHKQLLAMRSAWDLKYPHPRWPNGRHAAENAESIRLIA